METSSVNTLIVLLLNVLMLFPANNYGSGLRLSTVSAGEETQGSNGATTIESRTVSVRINRPFRTVYDFLAAPENWNGWARGLGKSIRRSQDGWIADTDEGTIKIRFTPKNDFGIVDHYVRRKSGVEIYVPMRLITNGSGCELLFTLFRETDMSDERYAADMEFVKQDLNALKTIVEKR